MADPDDFSSERPDLHPSARSSARLGLGEVDVIAPGVLHVRVAGSIRLEHVEPIMAAGDVQIEQGRKVLIAIDADDVHAYKAEVRRDFQAWIFNNKAEIEAIWVLFRSPLVKMGIGLVNAVTGGKIRGFSDPEKFDAALAVAISEAREAHEAEAARLHH